MKSRRRGLKAWHKWRHEHPNVLPDLRDADLNSADLRNVDLRNADLSYAGFSDADLSSADLRHAVLGGAVLGSTDLSGADLRDADLGGALLIGADFGGAKLINVFFCRASTRICATTANPPPNPVVPTCKKDRKIPPSVAVLDSRFKRFCPYRTPRRRRSLRLSVCTDTVFAQQLNTLSGSPFAGT